MDSKHKHLELLLTVKRKIFVSYHHGRDQWYYDEFSRLFDDTYEAVQDNSLDREIDSEAPEYVMRQIREDYITGTSCTIVLCGAQTPTRKYVDWEIKATLDKEHGLIGINLPSNLMNHNGKYVVPKRLYDNTQSGYALFFQWTDLVQGVDYLRRQIETANAKPTRLIANSREMRSRNG